MALVRTPNGHNYKKVSTPIAIRAENRAAQCEDGCDKCCCHGQTDDLTIEYCRVASSESDAKRDANPNSGTDKCCSSTLACFAGLTLGAAELGLIKLTGGLSLAAKVVAGAGAGISLARTVTKNMPNARDADKQSVTDAKLLSDMTYSESTHVPRAIKNVAIAGGAAAYGAVTGDWNNAMSGLAALTCVSQTGETAINCKQERPYIDCRAGGFWSACACSKCCAGEKDVVKTPLVGTPDEAQRAVGKGAPARTMRRDSAANLY